jgi:excisionase family DNA binding protein
MHADSTTGWATIQEAAARYQCSTKTIRRWIEQERIEAKRFGPRLIRVSETSLELLGAGLHAEAVPNAD